MVYLYFGALIFFVFGAKIRAFVTGENPSQTAYSLSMSICDGFSPLPKSSNFGQKTKKISAPKYIRMKYLLGVTLDTLNTWFQERGQPRFRAGQIFDWLYKKEISDIMQMSNLSIDLRYALDKEWKAHGIELVKIQTSDDQQTYKFLWQLHDGKRVESVLIIGENRDTQEAQRRTVCVSSQVGCPARCAFCASGREGLLRNLEPDEIIAQVYEINRWLQKERGERVSHIVYMGMGEPFRNYEAVLQSIRTMIAPDMMGISQRRITVSTVGVVEGIQRLASEDLKVNLVLSLHAPNQKLRQKIIPYAREYELQSILEAMYDYAAKTKRDITFEYTLLAGINDAPEHAHELVELLKNKQCSVNLIPYNPVAGLKLEKPSHEAIRGFRKILDAGNIISTCRYTKGDDIAAACGQLALQKS